jgi:hypothetical protein
LPKRYHLGIPESQKVRLGSKIRHIQKAGARWIKSLMEHGKIQRMGSKKRDIGENTVTDSMCPVYHLFLMEQEEYK